ncbi:hypothetical protein [Cuniculiplasma divulgatum]|jgi:hypothetical protein|uniref:Predicted metal-binding protein n=1 Tax=Cuniculiplasma divulgatum TaxID=1673428 RepID=A0A1R4A987_9ARCH|nr:hypothetical protein [Cuniculiplasma divulgatum]MCI2413255.1 hypothetical protein [Cuniculiplasma sp.]SJK85528.1 predicted metal-binding protein [Cuniculiplasma divulgatum]
MSCSNCFDAKGRKITKISVPHTETYKVGATNVTEGVTVVQFKEGPGTILNWKYIIEGETSSNASITYVIQHSGKTITNKFKTKYIDTINGKKIVHVEGSGLNSNGRVTTANKDVALSNVKSDPNAIECLICHALGTVLCTLLADGVSEDLACEEASGIVCLEFIEDPIVYVVCFGVVASICDVVLQTVIDIGVHVACELGADYICEKAIGCSL